MSAKHGSLSINSENIFPIIKKWLYSDHDIFVREMISNGCDAITKLKKLEVMGDYTFPDGYKPAVNVIVDPDQKTLKFIDNGIGMTADEVEEYITQIAFSGATEFLLILFLIKRVPHRFTGPVMVVQNMRWQTEIRQSLEQKSHFSLMKKAWSLQMNTACVK